jgi:hypothetical protein
VERHERTPWGFVCCVIVIGLLVTSLFLPWWTYKYSTGVKTPPGGLQGGNDTRVQREHYVAYPYRTEGRSNNTTAADVQQNVQRLGWLVTGSLVAAGLIAILEVPLPFFFSTRIPTLALCVLGFLFALASLVYGWFEVPGLLSAAGVDGPFTTKPLPQGFVQTWLEPGWVAAFIGLLGYPPVFLFKYQAGATDPTVIESFQKTGAR